MNVVALFRVSTERQANEGASLDSQEREYRELAARHGWSTVQEFRGCESATQAASERRVLQQVLQCIADRTVDAIYVHEQSRLTRGDELEVAMLMRELKERRIKILVHGILRDPASIDDNFMLGIQSLVDRAESARIKERLMRGKKQRALQGRKNSGPAPYGYTNPPPGDPSRGKLQIIKSEAAVVRKIFGLAHSQGLSSYSISKELNRLGVPSSRGSRWGKTSIDNLLNNPAYVGTSAANVWVQVGKTRTFRFDLKNPGATIVENAHEPIVERAVWDAVQNRVKSAPTAIPRMLTGVLFVNGEPFGGDSTGRGKKYYRGRRGERGMPWLSAEATDDAVWDAFVSLATGADFVESLMRANENPRSREIAVLEIEYLTDQIGKRERRLDRLVEMRADGEITRDQFAEKSGNENSELERLRRELNVQRGKVAAVDPSEAGRIVRAVQTLLAGRTRLTSDQKRLILRTIIRRVDIEAERTHARQGRAEGGGFASGRFPQWRIAKITLHVEAQTGESRYVVEPKHIEVEDGTGRSVTTFSCSDPRAPARR